MLFEDDLSRPLHRTYIVLNSGPGLVRNIALASFSDEKGYPERFRHWILRIDLSRAEAFCVIHHRDPVSALLHEHVLADLAVLSGQGLVPRGEWPPQINEEATCFRTLTGSLIPVFGYYFKEGTFYPAVVNVSGRAA